MKSQTNSERVPNLARQYLTRHHQKLKDWVGSCGDLANAIATEERDHIVYVAGQIQWKYHMVMMRDGLIHDAWCRGDAVAPREWLIEMFGANAVITFTLDGDDIYTGKCRDFPNELADSRYADNSKERHFIFEENEQICSENPSNST